MIRIDAAIQVASFLTGNGVTDAAIVRRRRRRPMRRVVRRRRAGRDIGGGVGKVVGVWL